MKLLRAENSTLNKVEGLYFYPEYNTLHSPCLDIINSKIYRLASVLLHRRCYNRIVHSDIQIISDMILGNTIISHSTIGEVLEKGLTVTDTLIISNSHILHMHRNAITSVKTRMLILVNVTIGFCDDACILEPLTVEVNNVTIKGTPYQQYHEELYAPKRSSVNVTEQCVIDYTSYSKFLLHTFPFLENSPLLQKLYICSFRRMNQVCESHLRNMTRQNVF